MNSKFVFSFLLIGLALILVLSGCVSSETDSKLIDSDSSSKATTTAKENSAVTEPVAKMKSCLFNIADMKFQYYATDEKVYMKTTDPQDNLFTEQTFTKTETCAKSVEGGKGCYDSTEEDFLAVLYDAESGNCTEIDYNKLIFEIK